MLTLDRNWLENGEPSPDLLRETLRRFEDERARLCALRAFYEGEHGIASRSRPRGAPNHRLWHDLPGYIVSVTSGYLVGEPVQYAGEGVEAVADVMRACVAASVDSELAVDAAIYGRGVEVYYADENALPRFSEVDARNAFVAYDDSVEHRPLFGVLLSDGLDRQYRVACQRVTVYTDAWVIHYERRGTETPAETGRERHFFGCVPMTEYWNNERERGDFEGVMNLIDAYDALQSDRVNDKQQFTDALMVIYGATVEREEDDDRPLQQRLRETRTLEMPASDARVEYLTKTLSESDTEILKDSLKSDIHKLCFVPDLTDREFAGNVSGVAMEYKLFGLEQLTKVKERWFREGLMCRLRALCHFLSLRGQAVPKAEDVTVLFSRSLPVNGLEVAQTVKAYEGIVPEKMLLSQVPFVEDADEAMRMKREQA